MAEKLSEPQVFISYSWTSLAHQDRVRLLAERLFSDGIRVVMDFYDLKEGQDKNAFMERMVNDPEVTHVLILSDKMYAEKADARKRGVGTESQIISQEVYENIEQSKFIPIVFERGENDEPFLPTYLKSRIWLDFSTDEKIAENWERLVRLLFGKPLYEKPALGKAPLYVREDVGLPVSEASAKLATLKQAVLAGKPRLSNYRAEFVDSAIRFADILRVRSRPQTEKLGEKVLADCGSLKNVRDLLISWVALEAAPDPAGRFADTLIDCLERVRELKARPPELNAWSEVWSEAHRVFVYEVFLYVVASLLRVGDFSTLHRLFSHHYLKPAPEKGFENFGCFYGYSEALGSVLSAPEGRKYLAPAAELIKRQADREDIPFNSIIQAELLVFMMVCISSSVRWYPQTLLYADHSILFPFFTRATRRSDFENLAFVTGIDSADELRAKVKNGFDRLQVRTWHDFVWNNNFGEHMNLDQLDTLR